MKNVGNCISQGKRGDGRGKVVYTAYLSCIVYRVQPRVDYINNINMLFILHSRYNQESRSSLIPGSTIRYTIGPHFTLISFSPLLRWAGNNTLAHLPINELSVTRGATELRFKAHSCGLGRLEATYKCTWLNGTIGPDITKTIIICQHKSRKSMRRTSQFCIG